MSSRARHATNENAAVRRRDFARGGARHSRCLWLANRSRRNDPSRSGARPRACARRRGVRRCAPLLPRRNGWFRRPRARHTGSIASRPSNTASRVGTIYTGQISTISGAGRRVYRDLHRRARCPMAPTRSSWSKRPMPMLTARSAVFAAVSAAAKRRTPRRRYSGRPSGGVCAATRINSSRVGAIAAIGASRYRRVRAATRGDSFDGKRGRGTGPSASARPDLRYQSLYDFSRSVRQRRHAGAVSSSPRLARRAHLHTGTLPRQRHRRVLRRQLGGRARFDQGCHRRKRQTAVSWHRRQTGKTDRLRHDRERQAGLCDAGLSDFVSVERAHASRPDAATDRAPGATDPTSAHAPICPSELSRLPAAISSIP